LSVLLHSLNGSLLALLILRRTHSRVTSLVFGALFVALPILGEPVLWLSASFDLWACFFALLTLVLIDRDQPLPASASYLLGLMSKESIFTLPLLLPFVTNRLTTRTAAPPLAAVAVAYGLLRWGLFHGIGGYTQAEGYRTTLGVTFESVVRTVLLNIPYAVLVPFKTAYNLRWLLGALSLAVFSAILLPSWSKFGKETLLRTATVGLISCLPTLQVLGIASDFAGGRFFYLPAAMVALSLGIGLGALPFRSIVAAGVLLVYWSGACLWNAQSWTVASQETAATLNAMRALQNRFPTGARVLVDASDMRDGAYVLRGGLPDAAAWIGLRQDLIWRRGTISVLDVTGVARVGHSAFEIGVDEKEVWGDRTPCAQALIREWEQRTEPSTTVTLEAEGARRLFGAAKVTGVGAFNLRLTPSVCRASNPTNGLFLWRAAGAPFFTMTHSDLFRVSPPDCEMILRVPKGAAKGQVEFRVDFERPMPLPDTGGLATLTLLPEPRATLCR